MYGQKQPSGLDELKKRLKEDRTGGAFLLWGAEEYTKDFYAEKLRKLGKSAPLPEFNYVIFDTDTQTPGELEEATFALPYLWEKRVIELRGSFLSKKMRKDKATREEEGEQYARILSSLPEYLTVLLVLRAGEKEAEGAKGIVAAFEQHGLSVEFKAERGEKLCNWVAKHFAARGVTITPQFPSALIAYCGTDMYTLQGEIEKLCSYALCEGAKLTERDISLCCCPNESGVFFDVADCMNRQDIAGARRILSMLQMNDAAVMQAMGYLASSYRLMLLVQAGREQGKNASQIASEYKLSSWQVNRALSSLSRTDPAALRYALSVISETDKRIKNMRTDSKAALELLVYRICSYGKNSSVRTAR